MYAHICLSVRLSVCLSVYFVLVCLHSEADETSLKCRLLEIVDYFSFFVVTNLFNLIILSSGEWSLWMMTVISACCHAPFFPFHGRLVAPRLVYGLVAMDLHVKLVIFSGTHTHRNKVNDLSGFRSAASSRLGSRRAHSGEAPFKMAIIIIIISPQIVIDWMHISALHLP